MNKAGVALNGAGLSVGGYVLLRQSLESGKRFTAEGEVNLADATVGRSLDCSGGKFDNGKQFALIADDVKIQGSMLLGTTTVKNLVPKSFQAIGGVSLRNAKIEKDLECSGGQFLQADAIAILGDRSTIKGSVSMTDDFKAEGQVSLFSATIGKGFDCSGGTFTCSDQYAVNGENLKVQGNVLLRTGTTPKDKPLRFIATGGVNLFNATIETDLDCTGGQFINPNGTAFLCDGATITGFAMLRDGFKAQGQVNFSNTHIGQSLDCSGGIFSNAGNTALSADGSKLQGCVFLRPFTLNKGAPVGFSAVGAVSLIGASIGQDLDCSGGSFRNGGNTALSVDSSNVQGYVFLGAFAPIKNPPIGFTAEGAVNLFAASIGQNLDCSGGTFSNPQGVAVNAEAVRVRGYAFLRRFVSEKKEIVDFKAQGEVRFQNAAIEKNLEFTGGVFDNGGGIAINADGLKVQGGVLCDDGFQAAGEVLFDRAVVGGYFQWTKVASAEKIKRLSFNFARIGTLGFANDNSWPKKGTLLLDGLIYDQFDLYVDETSYVEDGRLKVEELKGWLSLQIPDKAAPPKQKNGNDGKTLAPPKSGMAPNDAKGKKQEPMKRLPPQSKIKYYSQPYTQLASVLKRDGHEDDAIEILIAKNYDEPHEHWYQEAGSFLFGHGLGYGYRPWNAAWGSLAFIVLGWVLFGMAFKYNQMTPQGGPGTQCYISWGLIYSFEAFTPVLDLFVVKKWTPRGGYLYYYRWFHITMGWILTTLLVVGLTGLIQK